MPKPRPSASIKIAVPQHREQRVMVETLRDARRSNMSLLQEAVGWNYNAVLTLVQVKAFRNEWRCVIKAKFHGRPMIAFVHGASFAEACERTVSLADQRALVWHSDKKPAWARS